MYQSQNGLDKETFCLFSIVKMQEGGILEKFKREWMNFSSECSELPKPSSASLQVSALSGIFIMVGVMSGTAILILLLECCLYCLQNQRKKFKKRAAKNLAW